MSPRPRVYLDHAATSFPKPRAVIDAMVDYMTRLGASPGRGTYAAAAESSRILSECRRRLARVFNAPSPDAFAFTLNTTDALNLAIKGIIRARRGQPAHIITTSVEHNAVVRPLAALEADGVSHSAILGDRDGIITPEQLRDAMRPGLTALVVVTMAGNITGALQPIAPLAQVCRDARVVLLVDAAQTAGHVPIDVGALGIDLLAFPGHKGLLGPSGTGGLYVRPGVEPLIATTREGGSGSASDALTHPQVMPHLLEAGTPNTVGIAGLSAALELVLAQGIDSIRAHELDLSRFMIESLARAGVRIRGTEAAVGDSSSPLSALTLIGPADPAARTAVFSLTHDSLTPEDLAVMLEQHAGIECRAGLTCAGAAHAALGTLPRGVLRISFGSSTTRDDVALAVRALIDVAAP